MAGHWGRFPACGRDGAAGPRGQGSQRAGYVLLLAPWHGTDWRHFMIFHGILWYFMVVHSILIFWLCFWMGRFGISYDSIGTVEICRVSGFPCLAWQGISRWLPRSWVPWLRESWRELKPWRAVQCIESFVRVMGKCTKCFWVFLSSEWSNLTILQISYRYLTVKPYRYCIFLGCPVCLPLISHPTSNPPIFVHEVPIQHAIAAIAIASRASQGKFDDMKKACDEVLAKVNPESATRPVFVAWPSNAWKVIFTDLIRFMIWLMHSKGHLCIWFVF